MANIESFYPGDTVIINIDVYRLSGTKYDPTSVKVTIYDPSGEVLVDEQDATNDDTGEYHYDYNAPSDAEEGIYTVKVKGTDGSRIKLDRDTFEIKSFDTGA